MSDDEKPQFKYDTPIPEPTVPMSQFQELQRKYQELQLQLQTLEVTTTRTVTEAVTKALQASFDTIRQDVTNMQPDINYSRISRETDEEFIRGYIQAKCDLRTEGRLSAVPFHDAIAKYGKEQQHQRHILPAQVKVIMEKMGHKKCPGTGGKNHYYAGLELKTAPSAALPPQQTGSTTPHVTYPPSPQQVNQFQGYQQTAMNSLNGGVQPGMFLQGLPSVSIAPGVGVLGRQ